MVSPSTSNAISPRNILAPGAPLIEVPGSTLESPQVENPSSPPNPFYSPFYALPSSRHSARKYYSCPYEVLERISEVVFSSRSEALQSNIFVDKSPGAFALCSNGSDHEQFLMILLATGKLFFLPLVKLDAGAYRYLNKTFYSLTSLIETIQQCRLKFGLQPEMEEKDFNLGNLWLDLEYEKDRIQEFKNNTQKYSRAKNISYASATLVKFNHGNWSIPANFVDTGIPFCKFIIAQSPRPQPGPLAYFWRAVAELTPLVVNLERKDRREELFCFKGFRQASLPEKPSQHFLGLDVTLEKESKQGKVSSKSYVIANRSSDRKQEITEIQYDDWMDSNDLDPSKLEEIIDFVKAQALLNKGDKSSKPYLFVQDNLSYARSAMFVTAFTLKEKILSGDITRENLVPQLCKIIQLIREQRSKKCIDNFFQFRVLVNFGMLCLEKKKATEAA